MMGLVPGINDLERGIPWPKDISTSLKFRDCRPKLDSFKRFCDSAANSTVMASFQSSSPASSHTEVEYHVLRMPNHASISQDGWMDTSNWFFELLWNDVRDFDLDELYEAYFKREYRPEYGQTHAINRQTRPEKLDKTGDGKKRTSKENHSEQERLRRERHRFLQKEADNAIPTFVFDKARESMKDIKMQAEKESHHDDIEGKNMIEDHNRKIRMSRSTEKARPSEKVAGKDDQLAAAVMTQHLASILVCRQHERIVDQHDRIARLEETIAYMSQQPHFVGEKQERERELPVRGCGITTPVPAVFQESRGLKRVLDEVNKSTVIFSQQPLTSPHPMKRQRHLPKPAMHFSSSQHGLPGPGLLPPSPTPSHEGCGSYFSCMR